MRLIANTCPSLPQMSWQPNRSGAGATYDPAAQAARPPAGGGAGGAGGGGAGGGGGGARGEEAWRTISNAHPRPANAPLPAP
jgi:hypothetical protein